MKSQRHKPKTKNLGWGNPLNPPKGGEGKKKSINWRIQVGTASGLTGYRLSTVWWWAKYRK
jgi:hypothetical protein